VHGAGAHEAVALVAEYLQAGVVQSAEGKGAIDDESDLSLGAALWPRNPLRRYVDAADVVLAVGSRLAVAAFAPDQQVIQIDVDEEEIGRNHTKTFGLVGDARATLGAKVACPRRPVVAISGDGGFMYNVQELSTAAKYGINVVQLVFNDNAYGNVARDLDEAWGGSYEAELKNPDFMKLAEAFGV